VVVDRILVRNIRSARLALGLTQAEFADLAGVGLRSLEAWEAGEREPSKKNLRKVATATAHPVSWFLDEEDAA